MKYVELIKKCNIKISHKTPEHSGVFDEKNGIECKEQFSHFIF